VLAARNPELIGQTLAIAGTNRSSRGTAAVKVSITQSGVQLPACRGDVVIALQLSSPSNERAADGRVHSGGSCRLLEQRCLRLEFLERQFLP